MTADHNALPNHPAPHRNRVSRIESVFGLVGGPLAWFVQLNIGYALASWPCFPKSERMLATAAGLAWTGTAMVIALVAAVALSLAALAVSWQVFTRTRDEFGGDHHHLMETGAGRTRFLALWGVLLGGGFAVATAVTAVAFIILPRCGG